MKNVNFKEYKLEESIQKSLSILKYEYLTPVQKEAIPMVLKNKDIIVKSQTGSGKTLAFALPICQMVDWEENKPQALIITPTRELAMQVRKDISNIGRFKRIKSIALYGKSSFAYQEKQLKQKMHVVVGTPGRILDHINRGTLDLSKLSYLVIDEADEMLSMGFLEDIENIIKESPRNRTSMLFSATLPEDIKKLSNKYMKNPAYIEIEEDEILPDKIEHVRYKVDYEDKMDLLENLTIIESPDTCIIFCNRRDTVDQVEESLDLLGYPCEKIHGAMEQDDRTRIMNNFKKGYFRYLIATDVAARGIDVDNISHVINYDLPEDTESYVHRTGRTGRAGNQGKAISLVTPEDLQLLEDIHSYIGFEVKKIENPTREEVEELRPLFNKKIRDKVEVKKDITDKLNKDIIKLHIAAGRKTKMRPTDIVGAISNIEGVSAGDIGIIDIQDISTFVEILNNKGEIVLKALETKPIKGRLRRVSIKDDID